MATLTLEIKKEGLLLVKNQYNLSDKNSIQLLWM